MSKFMKLSFSLFQIEKDGSHNKVMHHDASQNKV